MAYIEEVINGLEKLQEEISRTRSLWTEPTVKAIEDAIELLKEQKADKWHFIKFRKATNEEKEYYKEEYGEYNEGDADNLQMMENVPADGEEVLLWTWCGFTVDTYDDGMFENAGEIEEGMAWRYLPLRPREDEQE